MPVSRRNLLLGAACRAFAQQPDFSTGVDVVTLLATVRDRDGLIAKNLSQDDFLLQDGGVPQTIRYFSRESDLPLTVGCWSTPAKVRPTFWSASAAQASSFSTGSCGKT